MDFSKFKTSDWLKAGGGLGFLIFFFLPWMGFSGDGWKGSHYFFTGWIPFLLLVGTGVLTVIQVGMGKQVGKMQWPLVFLAASALGTLLVLVRLIIGDDVGGIVSVDLDRQVGLYLAVLAALVVTAGAFLGFKETGGDLNDLTDVNKLKGAFNPGMGTAAPPPPPPGAVTPPPPPPPPSPMDPPPPPA